MKRLSLWWRALRPFSLTVSFLPPLLGGALALLLGRPVSPLTLSLTLIGCMAAHGASNLISDYYDFVKRVDRPGTYGSSGLLVAGLVKPSTFLAGGGFLGALAGAGMTDVSMEEIRQAVTDLAPAKARDANLTVLELGYRHFAS